MHTLLRSRRDVRNEYEEGVSMPGTAGPSTEVDGEAGGFPA